jgi:hypothetical protein
MFKIRAEQVNMMESDALEAFLVEMEDWALETYGPRAALLPEGTIRAEVLRARALGFVLRGHAKLWLRFGFAFQMPFADVPWAIPILNDAGLAPAGKFHLLKRRAAIELPRGGEGQRHAA